MFFRTVVCLLSVAPIALIGAVWGSALAPNQALALDYVVDFRQLKASSKDNTQLFEKLGLNSSQVRKVQAIYEKYEPEIVSRRQAIVAAKNEIKSSLAAAPQQQQKKVDRLKQELAAVKNKYSAEMQAALTANQWSKLQRLRKERQE